MVPGPELRILVVEDNPADALRVREALDSGGRGRFRPVFVGGLREAEERLPAADLVLLDLSLPDSAGADTVARVREKAPGIPVVVLSGERDEGMAFRCLQHGAQDVLLKGAVDGDALVRALSCALERQALARERDEALLRARGVEADLRRVLEAAREGILIADPRGRALFANPAAEGLLGWKPGEGAGRAVDLPLEVGGVMGAGRTGADGRPAVLEVRTSAFRWEGVPATLTSIHDVAQRRRRERSPGDAVEARAGEERMETVRRIASGISRGLGEHLASVLEGAFELSEGSDSAAYGPALKIQRAAWQATGFVRMLTACAGESKAVPGELDLSEVVASHWDRVGERGSEAVRIERDLEPALPPVLADRRLLELALLVLVDHGLNSVADGGTVTVRTSLDARGRRAILAVSDTGPAFGPLSCRRIFEPFYSTSVMGIGTGLGLAPVLGIALRSGGTADVASVPGLGTTVRILLPIVGSKGGGMEGEGARPGSGRPPRSG